jgi:hypothetical protein
MKVSVDKKGLLTLTPDDARDVFDLGALSTKLLRYHTSFNCSVEDGVAEMGYLKMSADELTHVLLSRAPKD